MLDVIIFANIALKLELKGPMSKLIDRYFALCIRALRFTVKWKIMMNNKQAQNGDFSVMQKNPEKYVN